MADISIATDDDIARFYGAIEFRSKWAARALRRGRLIAGFGGLLEIEDGVWFAFFDVPAEHRKPSIYRHILSAFREAKAKGAQVFKAKCTETIPRAVALMEHLGFERTDEMIDDEVVWVCPASKF
ncbi:hypothetical protein QTL95_27030 [Rhizobium sp. S152]|uniref:hypothetical protein n=1 Tax=Rhizobium sp. S152 TaxID=3055038 RepID=UPI00055CBBF1|nr:hypothetical protein [Rhizobium sp. S152]MDM9629543.1 hypothetical protein [Rhizobium sp. S152]